jgi:hypothetical protein
MAIGHQSVGLHDVVAGNTERLVDLRQQPYDLTIAQVAAGMVDALRLTKNGIKQHTGVAVLNRPECAMSDTKYPSAIAREAIGSYKSLTPIDRRRGIVSGKQVHFIDPPIQSTDFQRFIKIGGLSEGNPKTMPGHIACVEHLANISWHDRTSLPGR